MDAGLHAVTPDDEIEVLGRVLDVGGLAAVVLLKGQGAEPGLDGTQHRHHALGQNVAAPQQIVHRGVQGGRQPGEHLRIGGAAAGLPFAHRLLGNPQRPGKPHLGVAPLVAKLLEPLFEHMRALPFHVFYYTTNCCFCKDRLRF